MRWPYREAPMGWQPYRPWFAWHPVVIGSKWVWLETVMRSRCIVGILGPVRDYAYNYRLPNDPSL